MHTYRDALLRSTGSYVLYPGDVPEIYPKPVEGRGGILPSVGAIRLVPERGTEDLDEALERIFEDVVGTMGETCIEKPARDRRSPQVPAGDPGPMDLSSCVPEVRCPRCGLRPRMKSNSQSPEGYVEAYRCECGLRFAIEVSILEHGNGLSAAQ